MTPELGHRIHHTGRVMIGLAYEPPERVVDVGREAERLQSALLHHDDRITRAGHRAVMATCLGIAAVLAGMALGGLL